MCAILVHQHSTGDLVGNAPKTQGKIERRHKTLKNRFLLEEHFLEGEFEAPRAAFIDHVNKHRYHESIGNLTPVDVYLGRGEGSLAEKRRIKTQTIQNHCLNHQQQAAYLAPDKPAPSKTKSA
jgi:putative transposase